MKDGKSVYLLLTLTVRSCSAEELEQAQTLLISGLEKFAQIDQVKRSFNFCYKFLEIVRHFIRPDIEYHPHFHCVVAVRKSYFKSKNYLSHKAVEQYWRQSCGLDYDPIVEVRKLPGFEILVPTETEAK